ncbi:MAG: hypothetical protein QOD92_605 [Acidimicrobiaceae bacterium]
MKGSPDVIETEEDDDVGRVKRDQGGFVLPWMALMLLVLIAMAGFGVDVWNWWYTSQKVQRAADAGALAGVPFMPGNLNTTSPSATTTAVSVVQQNGYPSATVAQGEKANQLVVSVTETVNNYFTSLLGLNTTTITRSATAEFNAPVQMGSPVGHICNDPDNGGTDKEWCNIGAPGVDKHTGDRYADYTNCSSPTYLCTGTLNTEYLDSTYIYTIDLPTVPAGGVDIQVYDGEYANGAQNCDNQWLTAAQLTSLTATYPDAATRYGTGQTGGYCTGDDNTNLGTPQATAWLVRTSAGSLFQPLDPGNVVVSNGNVNNGGGACAHQFLGYNPNSSSYWFNLLDPSNAAAQNDPDFALSFHRWYSLCHVDTAGRYFVQVRSNVPQQSTSATRNSASVLESAQTPPSNTSIGGQNRYSVRVVNTGTNNVTAGSATYAQTRLPIYTNTTSSSTPNFFLARLVPGGVGSSTGRTLNLEFYDIGDVGGTTTLTVKPPTDATGSTISCSQWTFNGSSANAAPSGSSFSGCVLSGITSANYPGGFNGVLVNVKVNVPGDYNCTVADPNGCWFKIQMTYSSGAQANDTTTWSASIGGDPVRLIK